MGSPAPVQPVKITELLGRGRLCLTHAKGIPFRRPRRIASLVGDGVRIGGLRRRISAGRHP
jgi:hypothetical protein